MASLINRRGIVLGGLALCSSAVASHSEHPFYGGVDFTRDPSLIPPPESPVDYPVPVGEYQKVPEKFRRQEVTFGSPEPAGSLIVDPEHRLLYYILGNNQAIRYGVGVGREGFAWSGRAIIGMKRRWPRWVPPESMVERDENASKWANGMPGGPENPLGARALYLNANGVDTLYRIHGTNDPLSIGKAMSSGCVRMLNEDVADLFERVKVGTEVVVLAPGAQ